MNWKIIIRLLPLLLSLGLHAQTIESTVGGSELNLAYGVRNAFKWRELQGWTGIGYNDGFKLGAYLQIPVSKETHIGAGDQWLSSFLDTDEFDTHSFSVRGLSFNIRAKSSTQDKVSLEVFSGLISKQYEYPYLLANSTSTDSSMKRTAMTAILCRSRLSKTIQTHAVVIWDGKFTSIGSIGWKPLSHYEVAGAAGTGSDAAYYAARGSAHFNAVDLDSSYTVAGSTFHRQEQPWFSTEPVGWNAGVRWTPIHSFRLVLNQDHQRTWFNDLPMVESTSHSASLSGSVAGFQLGSSVSGVRSNMLAGLNRTEMFSASRRVLPRWRSFGSFINMDSPQVKQQALVAINEFRLDSRLSVRQNFSRVNGANSYSGGATWLSNRVSFSVDNQLYVSPLAASFGGKSIFQAWTFDVRLRTPHHTTVNESTFVDATGKMMWGGYLSGLRYERVGSSSTAEESASFAKYIVYGKVVNEEGKGVWGVAVQVGGEMVYSDSNGEFFMHVRNSKPLSLTVVPASSMQTSWWKLHNAPATVHGVPDGVSTEPAMIELQTTRTMAAN